LKSVNIKIPLGVFCCVTGVSGSGKSTLINETLYPILRKHFYRSNQRPMAHKSIKGLEHIDKVIEIDQSLQVDCETCMGRRYNRETTEILFKGKSISDVLNMTVDEAVEFFEKIPSIYRKTKTLQDVGLGYITLGQQATTISGGEAQRVKLSEELSKRDTGQTLYILDEPTTGLHFEDIRQLLQVLNKLVDKGNTIIIIEHNMDVIKVADHIIDMGPEGGHRGGTVVATGTPEKIAANKKSHTGRFLVNELKDVNK